MDCSSQGGGGAPIMGEGDVKEWMLMGCLVYMIA